MLSPLARQRGFTLTELMVGSLVSLLLLAAAGTVYVRSIQGTTDNLAAARINQELRAVMSLMVRDLRRAGYAALQPGADNDGDGDTDTDDLAFNPFTSGGNDVSIGAFAGEAAASCITYSYNRDEDSPPRIGVCSTCDASADLSAPFNTAPYDDGNMEMYGFRLRDGAVEMRNGLANPAETSFDCNSGNWQDLTDATTEVTALAFTLNTTKVAASDEDGDDVCDSGESCLYIREVDITLAGRLANDTLVQKQVSETVLLRNDRFATEP